MNPDHPAVRPKRANRRGVVLPAAMLVVAVLIPLVGCGGGGGGGSDYSATDLRTGDAVSVDSLRGRPAVLVSWATWCKECDEILGGLSSFASSKEAEGIQIVAVNLDAASVDAKIDAKIARHHLDVTLWRDRKNRFKRSFGALGVPTTVVLDGSGVVVEKFPGAVDFSDAKVAAALERARKA